MKTIPVNDQPISVQFDIDSGDFNPFVHKELRKVSDLSLMFRDQEAVAKITSHGDRTVYEIRYHPFQTSNSDMALGTTVIMPGMVGNEYHMTKGHFHETDNQPEVYHCIKGNGYLLMMNRDGEFHSTPWKPGTITHIPPQFAHRVINIGDVPLIFIAVFHLAAGHDYGMIVERGFKYLMVEKDGQPVQILNPKWA
jgi:glucose-6-phosphate isomerase